MQEVLRRVQQVAPTNATVLITGETGVGKDVIAQAIHESSPRKTRPFKAVNCGVFHGDLLQSELFGHEKGAFTDAATLRRGVFEQAHTGTLFLDEVGEMSLETQVKFLRVLETREFTRLGGDTSIFVDVRLIAATNVELSISVQRKTFRQDLYYRFNLFRIHIPPLRERREDIPLFVHAFIKELSAEHGKQVTGITPEALAYLEQADWPGNVRQLKNAVESAIIVATSAELKLRDFPLMSELEPAPLLPARATAPLASDTLENVAIYKTILGLIFAAIRLLGDDAPALMPGQNELQIAIPDEDTSWLQIADDVDASAHSQRDILQKALTVLSTVAKQMEETPLPLPVPVEDVHDREGVPTELHRDKDVPPTEHRDKDVPPTELHRDRDVPPTEIHRDREGAPTELHRDRDVPPTVFDEDAIGKVGMTMAEIEKAAIQKTLTEAGGNKTEAAKILDIGVRTLHRKLETYRQDAQDD